MVRNIKILPPKRIHPILSIDGQLHYIRKEHKNSVDWHCAEKDNKLIKCYGKAKTDTKDPSATLLKVWDHTCGIENDATSTEENKNADKLEQIQGQKELSSIVGKIMFDKKASCEQLTTILQLICKTPSILNALTDRQLCNLIAVGGDVAQHVELELRQDYIDTILNYTTKTQGNYGKLSAAATTKACKEKQKEEMTVSKYCKKLSTERKELLAALSETSKMDNESHDTLNTTVNNLSSILPAGNSHYQTRTIPQNDPHLTQPIRLNETEYDKQILNSASKVTSLRTLSFHEHAAALEQIKISMFRKIQQDFQ